MCTFVDSEVVLLNSLRNDENNCGVEYRDIRDYCSRLKRLLFENGKGDIKCVSFQVSKSSLEENVKEYPGLFRLYSGRYYRGVRYNPRVFDRRNGKEINQALIDAALN